MSPSILGLLVGVALGYAAIFGGFGDMLIVALIAAVGFVIGKALEGDLDLSQISEQVTDAVKRR